MTTSKTALAQLRRAVKTDWFKDRDQPAMTENLVNAVATEPMKRFQPNLTQIFPTFVPRSGWVLKVRGSYVKVTKTLSKTCQ